MDSTASTYGINGSTAGPEEHRLSKTPASSSLTFYVALALVGYVSLCWSLRFRRVNNLRARLGYTDRASLARMSIEDAQAITSVLARYESPLMYDMSLRLALLRTYTVKNVAKVLVGVSDLAKLKESPKRYEDTSILYTCWVHFKSHDEGFLKAVARMNFLHAPYIKSGKIHNEDLLYVLWASMAYPVLFLNIYEWRGVTDMEHAAVGALWKYIGDLMGIDYKAEMGHDEWTDGIEFMDELNVWAGQYEDKYMKPYSEVRTLGETLMNLFCDSYPKMAKPVIWSVSRVLMGDRMRHAFGFPEPGLAITVMTYSLMLIRMVVLRYFCPPRLFPVKLFSDPDPKTGRIAHYSYMREPWYNRDGFLARWGLEAWLTRSYGGIVPGDKGRDGEDFKSGGFLFEDIGPARTMGKGTAEVADAGRLGLLRPAKESPFTPKGKA